MSGESADLMGESENVQRIMRTGTVWFSVALGVSAVSTGSLLASGWRPAVLPAGLGALWWAGAALVALSLGLLGWSGCPILEVSVTVANRNKTRTMQLGTLLLLVGGVLALLAVALGPAP
ncbi:hypothetical protein [Microterricola viridarii]|uniref:Uncharacterized protein n=1 Tax=Microterricola viridarii TaxID=412690 RepID=A0A1H1WJE6_9MICO|nr:hypothetical protein [Microterricola viridarii]SDS97437.1 hypothetical protein SAMN04489834_2554 [Microterricola viridarii]